MLEGLDEALTGLSAEETTTFVSKLAGGERAGEEAQIKVTAQSVKIRELPEADDEFAEMASEFDTIDELKEDLRAKAVADAEGNRVRSEERRVGKECRCRWTGRGSREDERRSV